MKKTFLAFAITVTLLLPLGCHNNYRLGMESGPWGMPLVKIQRRSKIPNDIDPFIRNDVRPPQTFRTDDDANAGSNLSNDSGIQQAGFKTHDRSKNPFAD